MNKTALWEALHTRGHDAAHLTSLPDGWRLTGSAVYLTDEKAAGVNYSLDLNSDWSTRCGSFQGFVGGERVNCDIARDDRGWTLNGVRQRGLEGAVDLDFGFTPATNYPQLQRMALKVGQATQITVAWMDVRSDILELSQIICGFIPTLEPSSSACASSTQLTTSQVWRAFVCIAPGGSPLTRSRARAGSARVGLSCSTPACLFQSVGVGCQSCVRPDGSERGCSNPISRNDAAGSITLLAADGWRRRSLPHLLGAVNTSGLVFPQKLPRAL